MQINELLVILFLIFLACVYHGYRKGLVHIVVSVGIFVLTIVLVAMLAPFAAQTLKKNETVYQSIRKPVEKVLDENVELPSKLQEIMADGITWKTIDVVVYVSIFLVINIVLRILACSLELVTKIPGLHDMNQLAGVLLGAVEGLALIWLFFLIITAFASTEAGQWCFERIEGSQILSFLYIKNIFMTFI